jgi:hypothetical protein
MPRSEQFERYDARIRQIDPQHMPDSQAMRALWLRETTS